MPDVIEKYARGLYGPRSQTEYTSSLYTAGALPLIDEKREFTFRYDSYGFRKPEGEVGKRVAFGCSHTLGFELPLENSWPFLLNATNFGVNSASPQTVARLVKAWVPESEIEEVLILMPVHDRREIYNPTTRTYTPLVSNILSYIAQSNIFVTDDLKLMKSEDLIIEFCKKYDEMNILDEKLNDQIHAECVESIKEDCAGRTLIIKEMETDAPPHDWLSRDRTHNGEQWNRRIASIFKKSLDISA